MPSPSTSNLPKPASWDEFEDICADILKKIWKDPYVVRNGRSGQKQDGVDIYGYPEHLSPTLPRALAGAQCKNTNSLSLDVVSDEVKKAEGFLPRLAEYLILTTASRDVNLQREIRVTPWPIRVHIMFWEDICIELSGHDDLIKKYFPGWARKTVSKDDVFELLRKSEPNNFDYDDYTGIYIYKRDIQLQIIQDRSNWFSIDGREFDRFEEDWVKRFPDPKAYRQLVYFQYAGVRLDTFYTALVDGGRYFIPYPTVNKHPTINGFQYHIGKILNGDKTGVESFDFGLQIAGISVLDE